MIVIDSEFQKFSNILTQNAIPNRDSHDFGFVYLIKNIINNKFYVGESKNPTHRLRSHLKDLMKIKHCNSYFQNSFNKYGIDAFVYKILYSASSQSELDVLEDKSIIFYKSRDKKSGYNIRAAGTRGHHSEETKLKIGLAHKGKINSLKTRLRISMSNKGRKLTQTQKDGISSRSRKFWNDNEKSKELREKKRKTSMKFGNPKYRDVPTELMMDLKYNKLFTHDQIIKYIWEHLGIKVSKDILSRRVRWDKENNSERRKIKCFKPNLIPVDIEYLRHLRYDKKLTYQQISEVIKKEKNIDISYKRVFVKLKRAGMI